MARAAAHLQQICRLSPTASASCDLEEERGETSACCQPAPATQQPPAGRAVSGTHNTPPGSSGLPDVSRPASLPSDLLSLVPSSRPLVAGCSGPTGERDSLAYRAARSETAIAPLSGYPAAAAQPLARVSDDAHAAPSHQCFPQRSLSSPVPGSSLSAAVHPGRHAVPSSTVGLDFVNAADFISTGSGSGLGLDGATGPAQDGMTWSSGSAPAEGAPSQLDMVPGQLDMASERIPGASETVLGASAPPPSGHGLARVPSLGQFSPGPLSRSRTQFAPPAFHLPPFPHLEPRAPGARFGTDDSGTGRWGYLRQMHADVDGISEAMGDSKLAIAAAMIRVRSDPGSTGSGSSVHRAGSSLTLADGRSFPPEGASVQCRPTAAAFSRYPDEASRNGMGEFARAQQIAIG